MTLDKPLSTQDILSLIESGQPVNLKAAILKLEICAIGLALTVKEGNKKEAAALLGMNRTTLMMKLKAMDHPMAPRALLTVPRKTAGV